MSNFAETHDMKEQYKIQRPTAKRTYIFVVEGALPRRAHEISGQSSALPLDIAFNPVRKLIEKLRKEQGTD
jgi:hypothetical protein